MHQEGKFPSEGWEQEAEAAATKAAIQISKELWGSFTVILVAAIAACLVGFVRGTVDPAITTNYGLAISGTGTSLARWATGVI